VITSQAEITTITVMKAVKQHEPHGDAVDAQVVVDVEAVDPDSLLFELQRGRRVVEAGDQRNGDDQPRIEPISASQRDGPGLLSLPIASTRMPK
jgi:hypothetical protein